jgi:dihydrofolate reductase
MSVHSDNWLYSDNNEEKNMRKVVFAMMTTINGRLDDPDAWVSGLSDDLYTEIDHIYSTFDTILVGHKTYQEMVEYWPGAEFDPNGSEISKRMASKMNAYRKYVISGEHEKQALDWNNAEQVLVHSDKALTDFVHYLKTESGKDIHLSGGASLAQSMIRLGLVDEYHFNIYPVVSAGATWFDQIENQLNLALLDTKVFETGVVSLRYKAKNT